MTNTHECRPEDAHDRREVDEVDTGSSGDQKVARAMSPEAKRWLLVACQDEVIERGPQVLNDFFRDPALGVFREGGRGLCTCFSKARGSYCGTPALPELKRNLELRSAFVAVLEQLGKRDVAKERAERTELKPLRSKKRLLSKCVRVKNRTGRC